MFPYCSNGMTAFDWAAMAALWLALLAVVVWVVTRVFPRTPSPVEPSESDRELEPALGRR